MHLQEQLIWMLTFPFGSLNHAVILCDDENREEIKNKFKELCVQNIVDEMKSLAGKNLIGVSINGVDDFRVLQKDEVSGYSNDSDYYVLDDELVAYFDPKELIDYLDIVTSETANNLLISYSTIVYYDGGYGEHMMGFCSAFSDALKTMKKQYPNIKYYGYEGYAWSDVHGGQAEEYEFHSPCFTAPERYDYVGKKIREFFENRDQRDPDSIESYMDDVFYDNKEKEFVSSLKRYDDYLPDNVLDILLEYTVEEYRPLLQEIWNKKEQ